MTIEGFTPKRWSDVLFFVLGCSVAAIFVAAAVAAWILLIGIFL